MPAPRKFSDEDLVNAIESSNTWSDVMERLGYPRNRPATTARARSTELGIDVSKFFLSQGSNEPIPNTYTTFDKLQIRSRGIGDRGLPSAMAWFSENGYAMSIPVSGASPYDLVVEDSCGNLLKIQVKTSTNKLSSGAYLVKTTRMEYIKDTGKYIVRPYTDNEVDYFFILVETGGMYLIPFNIVKGRKGIAVGNKYENFKVN